MMGHPRINSEWSDPAVLENEVVRRLMFPGAPCFLKASFADALAMLVTIWYAILRERVKKTGR